MHMCVFVCVCVCVCVYRSFIISSLTFGVSLVEYAKEES